MLTPNVELAARESFFYSSFPNGTNWMSTTEGVAAYQFNFGRLHPLIGAHVGYGIGIHNTSSFEVGPEGGLKFDLNDEVFLYAEGEWQRFFRKATDPGGIRTSAVIVSVGIGFRW